MGRLPTAPSDAVARRVDRSLRELTIVALATCACLLPFVNKALHIDDHRYVQMAQQIQADPFDFFGFTVNLAGSEQPEADVANNPPLASFYAASAAWITGWSEVGLHLAFLLSALAVTLGTWALGRGLCSDPLLAALICLTTPVFLVSATTVMADVSMTALFCGSIWLWRRGLETQRPGALLVGAGLAALCALTKYFGIALLPLLGVYSAVRERRVGAWAVYLLLPVAALFAFELYTWLTYGVSPIVRAASYSVTTRTGELGGLERAGVALVFVGGALASLLGFAAVGFTRNLGLASLALAALLLGACLAQGQLASLTFVGPAGVDWNLLAHVAIFATAGAALFVLVGSDLARRRDADALLLALWVLGTFVFATVVNYTTNGRALLPMAPPVAILLVRQLDARRAGRPLATALRYAPLLPALALSLAVAWGDSALADASRVAARRITTRYVDHPGTLWFEGGWGFQHYMREAGARSVDVRQNVLRPGDLLAGSQNYQPRLQLSPRAATVLETFELPLPWVTTMLLETGTGFYAIQWGPLPYRFLPGAAERFDVRRVNQLMIFEPDPEEIRRRGGELQRAASSAAGLLALNALEWPAPEGAATEREAWSGCLPGLRRLATAVVEDCGWVATPTQWAGCRDAAAEQAGVSDACAQRLRRVIEEQAARCQQSDPALSLPTHQPTREDGPAPLCHEFRRIRSALMGEPSGG